MKKFYVQNGYNKLTLSALNCNEAAKKFIRFLIGHAEKDELSPFTSVSEMGFVSDIEAYGEEKDMDNVALLSTCRILNAIGEKEISIQIRNKFNEDASKHPDPVLKDLWNLLEKAK